MTTVKGITTPLTANLKLCSYGSDYSEDPGFYKSILGTRGLAVS